MGMGVGGGGLFIIYLTLCANYDQITAQGSNLVFFIIAAFASILIHVRKRKIRLLQLLLMLVFGSVGTVVFSRLATDIPEKIPRFALGILLIISGIYTLICNNKIQNYK